MTANTANVAERMHHEIEIMTRRLELEKRRLQRLEKELAGAKRTEQAKRPTTARPSTPRIPPYRPNSGGGSGAAAVRCLSARGPRPPVEEDEGEAELEMLPMKHLVVRLENNLKKLDVTRDENKELKNEVHEIRMHKKQLGIIFERLKLHIRHRAEQLQDFVEDSAQSKGVSDDAQNRVEVMKRQREFERKQFKSEVMRIRKDLQSYEVEKREIEVQLKRAEEGVQKKKELIVPEEEKDFSESSMMRRIMKTAFLNCIQRRHIKQHQKSIEVFEQAFATIKQSTGISNIEEIVKIFVSLESRNYSLLTYVNHMNRDIEALEGLRRNRRELELQHTHDQEQEAKDRDEALGDMTKKLQATQLAMEEDREGCFQHREILRMVLPQISQVAKRLEIEGNRLRAASKEPDGTEFPRRPSDELREDTLLSWLNWVRDVLSRYRDLLPSGDGNKEQYFPSTAGPVVKTIQPKRPTQQPPPLVKYQELPSAPKADDELVGQKRQNLGAKGDFFDDESEEEDFGDRPLMMKDIRARAEQASAKKKKQTNIRRSLAYGEDGSGQTTLPSDRKASVQSMPTPETKDSKRFVAFAFGGPAQAPAEVVSPVARSDQENTEISELEASKEDADKQEEKVAQVSPAAAKLSRRVQQMMDLASATHQSEETHKDELDLVFLRRYKMSKQELEIMSDRMGLQLGHLCFLKKQFDKYDQDQSGYISAQELQGLFADLGEDLREEEMVAAVKELDGDGSGEIEFFEFAEWFTAPQS